MPGFYFIGEQMLRCSANSPLNIGHFYVAIVLLLDGLPWYWVPMAPRGGALVPVQCYSRSLEDDPNDFGDFYQQVRSWMYLMAWTFLVPRG